MNFPINYLPSNCNSIKHVIHKLNLLSCSLNSKACITKSGGKIAFQSNKLHLQEIYTIQKEIIDKLQF